MTEPIKISHAIIYSGAISVPQTNILRGQLSFLNQPAQPPQMTHLPCTRLLMILSSWGGGIYEARSLYGLIRSLPFPIDIHVVGNVKSAAIPLMLAADRRTAAPHTTFFFHPWTWGTEVHPGHSIEWLQQAPTQLEDDLWWGKKIFRERSKLTDTEIDNLGLFDKGTNQSADFALKYGLVHEIVERKIPHGIMTWNIA